MKTRMSGSGNDLASRHCVPCRGGVPPLQGEELALLSAELPDWRVMDRHHIERAFLFPNFKSALAFVNRIGEIAEEQGHHPDICFGWGSVKVTNYTHKIAGLTESDFILAAKIDRLYFPAANRRE
jgi:4a-hydroxytetrahydrobiopterin dehydratase